MNIVKFDSESKYDASVSPAILEIYDLSPWKYSDRYWLQGAIKGIRGA